MLDSVAKWAATGEPDEEDPPQHEAAPQLGLVVEVPGRGFRPRCHGDTQDIDPLTSYTCRDSTLLMYENIRLHMSLGI